MLDFYVLVIQMNHNLLNCVLVKTAAPWILKLVEKDLKNFASFNSDSILGIIETFEELNVEVSDVVFGELVLYVFKDMP